jgi:hypothetical protein
MGRPAQRPVVDRLLPTIGGGRRDDDTRMTVAKDDWEALGRSYAIPMF